MALDYNTDSTKSLQDGNNLLNETLNAASEPLKQKARNQLMSRLNANPAVHQVKEIAKNAVQKFLTATAEQMVGSGLTGLLSTILTPLLIILIVLCAVPLCLFSVNYIFEESPGKITTKVESALSSAYNQVKQDNMIMTNLNSHYGCKFESDDARYNADGSIDYITEGCEVHVDFTPNLQLISASVSAYTTAVNGTLSYYNQDVKEIDSGVVTDDEGKVVGYNTEGMLDIYDSSKYVTSNGTDENGMPSYQISTGAIEEIQKGFNSETTNALTDEFAQTIKEDADSFFSLEEELDLWENNSISPHTFTYTRDACYKVEDDVAGVKVHEKADMQMCAVDSAKYQIEEEEYEVKGYKGSVVIPIYYDLTDYKRVELEEVVDKLANSKQRCVFEWNNNELQGEDECTEFEAGNVVNNTMYNYYMSYVHEIPAGIQGVDYSQIPGFQTGTLAYFDVDAVELARYFGGSFAGVAGRNASIAYQSSVDWFAYAGTEAMYLTPVANTFWGHADYLKGNGMISGSTSSHIGGCTLFAQMWLYDVYGINQSKGIGGSGNGGNFASVLLENYPEMFEPGSGPTGGGIASVKYAGTHYGHVICIDETDYDNDRITYSEGNFNGSGGVRIRITCSLAQFYAKWPSAIWTFANPR